MSPCLGHNACQLWPCRIDKLFELLQALHLVRPPVFRLGNVLLLLRMRTLKDRHMPFEFPEGIAGEMRNVVRIECPLHPRDQLIRKVEMVVDGHAVGERWVRVAIKIQSKLLIRAGLCCEIGTHGTMIHVPDIRINGPVFYPDDSEK